MRLNIRIDNYGTKVHFLAVSDSKGIISVDSKFYRPPRFADIATVKMDVRREVRHYRNRRIRR